MRTSVVMAVALLLGACASNPEIDRVVRVTEFVTVPDGLLVCPSAPTLTEEEITLLETETDYNEQYVLPLFEARDRCEQSIEAVRELNIDAEARNAELKVATEEIQE